MHSALVGKPGVAPAMNAGFARPTERAFSDDAVVNGMRRFVTSDNGWPMVAISQSKIPIT